MDGGARVVHEATAAGDRAAVVVACQRHRQRLLQVGGGGTVCPRGCVALDSGVLLNMGGGFQIFHHCVGSQVHKSLSMFKQRGHRSEGLRDVAAVRLLLKDSARHETLGRTPNNLGV